MIPVHRGQFQLLQPSAWSWSRHLKQCVAVCNGIVLVKNTLLGGSSLEKSLFTAVGARFLVNTTPVVTCCDKLFLQSIKLQILYLCLPEHNLLKQCPMLLLLFKQSVFCQQQQQQHDPSWKIHQLDGF